MKRKMSLMMLTLILMLGVFTFPTYSANAEQQQVNVYFQNKSEVPINMWIGHFKIKELKNGMAVALNPGGHTLYYVTLNVDQRDALGNAYINDKIFASMVEGLTIEGNENSSDVPNSRSGRFAIKGYLKGVSIIFDGNEFFAKITYMDGTEENQVISSTNQTDTKDALPVAGVMVTVIPAGLLGALALKGKKTRKEGDTENETSYYMAVSKDFGDKIRCDADAVTLSAAIIEVTTDANGGETERIMEALAEQIQITAKETFVEISDAVIIDGTKAVNIMVHSNEKGMPHADTCTITFTFANTKGTLTQNIVFKVVGKPYIELDQENLYVLAASGNPYDLKYKLMDFVDETDVEIELNTFQNEHPFTLQTRTLKENKAVITATDAGSPSTFEGFYESYSCEIIAKSAKEYARTLFTVVMCQEGIRPDFLGREKEIVAYKDTEGNMPITPIAFRLGTWDENTNKLNVTRPEAVEVTFDDEQGIFEVIGLTYDVNEDTSTSDYLLLNFKAEKSLPNTSPVIGNLKTIYRTATLEFESNTEVKLMPDLLSYEKDIELEYQRCLQIIDTYLPPEFSVKKRNELDANRSKMGLADLQIFRRNCWQIASRFIMQEKENYLIDSYWYDEAIATADLLVYIGDVALDVALAPFGGPITGFVVTQVKAALMELVAMRIEKGEIGYNEIYSLIMKRLEQAAGQADGLIETPSFDKPKVLIAWLTTYILYRIMYRWYFDMDENNNPKGLTEAIFNGLMDFAGKGASIILGEYAKNIAKNRGINLDSTADAEQKWVNDGVEKATKAGLDTLDTLADTLDQKINEITATLLQYIERIRTGA